MNGNDMDRRTFLRISAMGAATAAASGYGCAQEPTPPPVPIAGGAVFRTLGRTQMKISTVSFGAMRTAEEAVFQAAFDLGVNYVDTARGYMNGRNEGIVGKALKGYRDKVYVATKVKPASKDEMRRSVETSLTQLKVDYVDLLQLHGITSKNDVANPEYREVLAEAKKQGKARFIGITTHKNEAEVINAVVDDPERLYDTVLVAYNFDKGPEVKEAIARAAKAEVGIVAMKTQAGGYKTRELGEISPHQAALKWVLMDTNVAAAIPSMINLEQLNEDLAVMGLPMTKADLEILERYQEAIARYHCRGCGKCEGTCPRGVDVASVNRCLMYAEGYGDIELARASYGEIPYSASVGPCGDCAKCTALCPRGINIMERVAAARSLFC